MDPRFLAHNSHLEGIESFKDRDPQLRRLKTQKYVHTPGLLAQLPTEEPGIYTLGGGRQIGKTTLLKQWMLRLLKQGIAPESIAFLSGELIDDQHSLLRLLEPLQNTRFLIIDEVTYIKDWDRGIKYLADAGLLENTILMLTGSDLVMIQEARMRFPGRRGHADICDFHLYPLSFREVFLLKNPGFLEPESCLLFEEFENYIQHGGFLTAINDIASKQSIQRSTYNTYSDWIRGDMLKRGKKEHFLIEILGAIAKRYGSQISWNALTQDLSIDHPKTVSEYIAALEMMDVVFVQHALIEDKLVAAPKKPKKIYFSDPFIYHALRNWLDWPMPSDKSHLVEACVASHYRRFFPTYYIKAEGEVDVVYISQKKFWPVEIKWTERARPKDLKQILKYPNGLILTKNSKPGNLEGCPMLPLPQHLFHLTGS
ncbi:MAG: ATP-binding protein [Myxococcaceae bacterium]